MARSSAAPVALLCRCAARRAEPLTSSVSVSAKSAGRGSARTPAPAVPAASRPAPEPAVAAAPEMRLVSVLFVDLVGFTSLSESRDAEDVRELLGRYFDSARTIVERYGGMVEKFIGDAVMAVWGVPVGARGRRRAGGPGGARDRRCGERVRRARSAPAICGRGRGSSPGRWPRSTTRARGWSSATASTRRRGCSRPRSPVRCWSTR